jgi:hypothetical protein
MITGQTNVIRYYPMFERSFAIMKRLIPDQCNIPEDAKREVEGMKKKEKKKGEKKRKEEKERRREGGEGGGSTTQCSNVRSPS